MSKVSKKDIGRVFKLILKTLETSVELITTGDFMVSASTLLTQNMLKVHQFMNVVMIFSPLGQRIYGISLYPPSAISAHVSEDVFLIWDLFSKLDFLVKAS